MKAKILSIEELGKKPTEEQVNYIVDHIEDRRDRQTFHPDDFFRTMMLNLCADIDKNRFEMRENKDSEPVNPRDFPEYKARDRIFVIGEAFHANSIWRNEIRDNGKPYFPEHLWGTVQNLYNLMGRTSKVSVVSGFHHDTKEDFELSGDDLFRPEIWAHLLGIDAKQARRDFKQEMERIAKIVDGVSKYKYVKNLKDFKLSRAETELAEIYRGDDDQLTIYRNLKYLLDELIIAYVKLADSIHNAFDIEGFDEKKKTRKGKEKLAFHLPLADLLKLNLAKEILMRGIALALNPHLMSAFDQEQLKRRESMVDPYFDDIRNRFLYRKEKNKTEFTDYIHSLTAKPLPLCEYLWPHIFHDSYATRDELGQKLMELSFSRLNLDPDDNMHEILILTNKTDKNERVIGKIISFLAAKNSNFEVLTEDINRGETIKIINRELGGMVRIRVNAAVAEARSRRGVAATESLRPTDIIQGLQNFMHRVELIRHRQIAPKNMLVMAREEILRPRIAVWADIYTPKEMPRGSTPLDLAERQGFDPAMIRKVISYENKFKKGRKEISLFEDLEEGHLYQFMEEKDLASDDRARNNTINPGSLLFCRAEARKKCKHHLLDNCSKEQLRTQGESFFKKVNSFAISEDQLLEMALKHVENLPVEERKPSIFEKIALNDINLLELLAEHFRAEKTWQIEVALPDKPETSDEFSAKIRGLKFNKQDIRVLPAADPSKKIFQITGEFIADVPLIEFLKRLFKLTYDGYEIQVKPYSWLPTPKTEIAKEKSLKELIQDGRTLLAGVLDKINPFKPHILKETPKKTT